MENENRNDVCTINWTTVRKINTTKHCNSSLRRRRSSCAFVFSSWPSSVQSLRLKHWFDVSSEIKKMKVFLHFQWSATLKKQRERSKDRVKRLRKLASWIVIERVELFPLIKYLDVRRISLPAKGLKTRVMTIAATLVVMPEKKEMMIGLQPNET